MGCMKSSLRNSYNSGLFKKQEKFQIHNLTYYLKELEKENQNSARRKEIIKIRGKINKEIF